MRFVSRWLACISMAFILAVLPQAGRGDPTAAPVQEEAVGEVDQAEASLASQLQAELEDKTLSDVERVRVFRQVTESWGLAFVGYVRLYPDRSYLDTFHWHKKLVSDAMGGLDSDVDVAGLLKLARDSMGSDALVSADALMLAAMIDWEASLPVLVELSNPNVVKDAQVRPIHVHALSLISAAKQSGEMIELLRPILRLTRSEEMREDILCAISALDDERSAGWIKSYIQKNLAGEHDQAMQTAFLILSVRQSPEAYQSFVAETLALVEDEADRERLTAYKDYPAGYRGIQAPPGAPWMNKGWDDFHFEIRDDGVVVRYRDQFEVFVQE